jgi:hypothetical protein
MFNQESKGTAMEPQMQNEKLLSYTASEVDSLLRAYEKYNSLAAQIASDVIPKSESKFSFGSNLGKLQNFDPKRELRKELEQVGESMKFQNSLIWLRYKYLAYANEPGKAICTLSDLIEHCKVDGICHRRFDAINLYLRRKYDGKDMTSSAFMDPSMSLQDVGQDPRFLEMCLDQEFMSMWGSHENSKSGKWREYELSSPDHDCEINCTC